MIKKRIIIIRNAKNYDFGGGERFPVFLAKELSHIGYDPIIISRSPKLLDFAMGYKIKTVRGLWWSNQNWSGKFALLFPAYLLWQIALFFWYLVVFIQNNPKVIHIQSKDDFIAATIAGKILGKKIIWTDHADLKHIWKNVTIWYKNPVGKSVYLAAKLADKITVVSQSERNLVKNNLKDNDFINHKIQVIHNGINDTYADYKNKKTDDTFVFCVASRLVTDKGIKEVIDAFSKLNKDFPNMKLELLGDGPEADKFKTYAQTQKTIEFLGHQIDPFSYIVSSDCFIHPTYHEGFSVALVEACMLERPIIATNVGGNPEIIHNDETGLLVPAKNTDELYKAMKTIYQNKDLRDRLARNARKQYLEKFRFDQIVKERFVPLYEGTNK